jgi:hypothetical protein
MTMRDMKFKGEDEDEDEEEDEDEDEAFCISNTALHVSTTTFLNQCIRSGCRL